MTYKTRQEVLRAAADWMDVCEKAGIEAQCKLNGALWYIKDMDFNTRPEYYEFPLALLEGKEVWVGSELYNHDGIKFTVNCSHYPEFSGCSWNPPKPKTVIVEMLVEDAEWLSDNFNSHNPGHATSAGKACKKALEKL